MYSYLSQPDVYFHAEVLRIAVYNLHVQVFVGGVLDVSMYKHQRDMPNVTAASSWHY